MYILLAIIAFLLGWVLPPYVSGPIILLLNLLGWVIMYKSHSKQSYAVYILFILSFSMFCGDICGHWDFTIRALRDLLNYRIVIKHI